MIDGVLPDSHFDRWTLDYLKAKAGEVPVEIEFRATPNDRYGEKGGWFFLVCFVLFVCSFVCLFVCEREREKKHEAKTE